ncbi:hypothetical protein PPSIR1_23414 [Plesiocystis pacifica SIR-1]|uniref:Fibrinogen C-terminal domain-containing protein n=1 Tax=Plesiocystis pacifica SIR-1 TaxID=391625 RepID=A6G7S5_9BACT|nr:fibrinogen-like YCDxxxxGGGW domain-containing protein [Plesiocystis pacifica]EDM78018.1 hypothetical protein PPSIR1_23414 [Plesiocystis pacifica SIR-1]
MKRKFEHLIAISVLLAATACGDSGDGETDEAADTETEESTEESTDTTTETTTEESTEETTETTEESTEETDTTEETTEEETDTTEEETTEEETDTTEEETTEEGPECMGNDGLTMETAGASCLEILENGCSTGDGTYWVNPNDVPFETNCDMTTDGGGWTQIQLGSTCNGDLDSTLTAVEPAVEEGVDASCRPFTSDGDGDHTYYWDITFLPTFEAFYLSDYSMRANGNDASGIVGAVFTQTSWDDANGNSVQGDVSFGSGDEPGPTTSFAVENPNVNCTSCVTDFAANDTPFTLAGPTSLFRIGWGEAGSEDEGWFPWWSGSVYLR